MAGRRRRSNVNRNSIDELDVEVARANVVDFNDVQVKFNFADVENVIRKFSGTGELNVKTWMEEFEQYSRVFRWNDVQKFVFCKRSLTGAAKLYMECEAKPLSYIDLKNALFSEFHKKITSADVHRKLSTRKKRDNESFREYLYIAAQADVDEQSVISYAIDGIHDTTVNKSVLFGSKNITEFKEKLNVYEKLKSYVVNERGEHKSKTNRMTEMSKNSRRCFNCGSSTHTSFSCPDKEKGPKCFKCNQFGHKRSACGKMEQPQVKVAEEVTKLKKKRFYKTVKINGSAVNGLVDTGSDICLIKEKFISVINPKCIFRLNPTSVQGLGGKVTTKGSFTADVEVDDQFFNNIEFHIMSNDIASPDLIIGTNLLVQATIFMDADMVQIVKKNVNDGDDKDCFIAQVNTFDEKDSHLPDLGHLQTDVADEVRLLVNNYKPEPPEIGPIQMKITLMEETPVFQRPRRFPPKEQEIINQQVNQWLKDGIIVESCSDYASPVVLVKKKDGSSRLCIDYRMVNKKICKDHYPLPVIEDQINGLQGANVFSTLDLENGFLHVPIEPKSRKFTSFVTQQGQYEFNRVPFGLCNSSSVFQRFINYVFKDLMKEGVVIIYLDDIIIPSRTTAEGVHLLKRVLRVAASSGLRIKWKKCQFLKAEVEYLGHVVRQGTVSPSPAKIKAVANFPVPVNAKKMESFLGLTGYFRKFIMDYSLIARPLSNLLKDGVKFVMGEEQLSAFNELKQMLTSKPILKIFSYGDYTELHTDACKYGYGAILFQKSAEDTQLRPVHYASWKTSEAEQRYSSYELEALAIVAAVRKFRIYLIGTKFKLITDCKAFTLTLEKRDLVTRIARWALLLEEFQYEVEHRSGSRMRHVDALSRNAMCVQVNSGMLERLREAQKRDDKIQTILKLLQHGPYKDFVTHHGLLCKEVDGKLLYVVPDGMKMNIIRSIHENGHFHYQKMKEKIENEFYIPELKRRIDSCIANCVECILAERKAGKPEALLNPIPKGDGPLETFHMDHLGPLTATRKGYRYIFAIIDAFTKFCWLFPTKSLNSEEVIQKCETVAATFGYPVRVITDRGGAFIANSFRDYCKSHDIKLYHITAGIPRGNGQIERLHSTVIATLTKLSLQDPEKWYQHITSLQKMLNSTYHRAIQMTPFELMVGTKMRSERDKLLMETIEQEFAKQFDEERQELREKAKGSIAKIQEESRRNFNRRRKMAAKYVVGDLVAIERTQFGVGLKVKPKFLGPYRVTVVKGFDRYQVEKVGNHEGPESTTTSADKIKRWVEDDGDPEYSEGSISSSETEELSEWPNVGRESRGGEYAA